MAAMMTTSLRQLRRAMDELGVRMDAMFRAKVGIQGRLNVDERAHYQRRHPAPTEAVSPDAAGLSAPEGAPGAAVPQRRAHQPLSRSGMRPCLRSLSVSPTCRRGLIT